MKKLDKDIELNRELHRICNMDLPESELIDKKLDAAYGQIYKYIADCKNGISGTPL